jgi:hypothetical protein
MRRTYTRLIAGAAAIGAGALAAFALRGPSTTATPVAARNPAVEVRTVVIRRTIHIVKHEHAAGASPGHGRASTSAVAGVAVARTRVSGSHRAASGTAVAGGVSTRTSGSHSAVGGATGAPVTTRTSSHGGSSGGSRSPVTTRTSAGSGGSGKPVATRSSGGNGGDGGDGGGDN